MYTILKKLCQELSKMQTSVVKVVELQACAPTVEDIFFFFFPSSLFKMTYHFFTYTIFYALFISLLSRLNIQSIITKINFKRVQFSYLGICATSLFVKK